MQRLTCVFLRFVILLWCFTQFFRWFWSKISTWLLSLIDTSEVIFVHLRDFRDNFEIDIVIIPKFRNHFEFEIMTTPVPFLIYCEMKYCTSFLARDYFSFVESIGRLFVPDFLRLTSKFHFMKILNPFCFPKLNVRCPVLEVTKMNYNVHIATALATKVTSTNQSQKLALLSVLDFQVQCFLIRHRKKKFKERSRFL